MAFTEFCKPCAVSVMLKLTMNSEKPAFLRSAWVKRSKTQPRALISALPIHFTDTSFIFAHCLSQSQHMTLISANCASLPSRNWAPKPWVRRAVEKWVLLSQLHERQVRFLLRPCLRRRQSGPNMAGSSSGGNSSSLALCCDIYMWRQSNLGIFKKKIFFR